MSKPVLLIFDLDGTIANNLVITHEVLNEVLVKYGYEPVDNKRFNELRNLGLREIMRYYRFPIWKAPSMYRFISESVRAKADRLDPIEGIPELIHELASRPNYKLVVVSSNIRSTIDELLERFNIKDCFFEVRSDALPLRKYLAMRSITRKHGKGATVIGIGDEPRDADGAKIASIHSIAVAWGLNSKERLERSRADVVVSTPTELKAAIEAMVN